MRTNCGPTALQTLRWSVLLCHDASDQTWRREWHRPQAAAGACRWHHTSKYKCTVMLVSHARLLVYCHCTTWVQMCCPIHPLYVRVTTCTLSYWVLLLYLVFSLVVSELLIFFSQLPTNGPLGLQVYLSGVTRVLVPFSTPSEDRAGCQATQILNHRISWNIRHRKSCSPTQP